MSRVRSELIESPLYQAAKRANKKLLIKARSEEAKIHHQWRQLFVEEATPLRPKHYGWQQYPHHFYSGSNSNRYQPR